MAHPAALQGRLVVCDGVTLVELMVAIAVLAALLAVGLPSFNQQMATWRRDAAVQAFVSHAQIARSTALRTSRAVVMCTSADGLVCDPSAQSNDWRKTWLVFVDANGNDALDNGETLVTLRPAATGIAAMSSNIAQGRLSFRPNGLLRSGNASIAVIAQHGADIDPVTIRINAVGRVSVLTP